MDCNCGSGRKMYAAESFLLRASIVLGMVAAVVTILYLTPMPDYLIKSCDRPCHDLDWPMICRFKLVIENHNIINSLDCSKNNQTDCDNSTSVINAVVPKNFAPGPSIQVCQNDVLVVDIINKLPGRAVTIHWRGQSQIESPYMDGAPMITQCPINSYTSFQYKFRASVVGTHLWHAHSGSDVADGYFGALIVRKATKLDPQRKLYDLDEHKHVVLISEWADNISNISMPNSKPRQLIINGGTPIVPHIFEVQHGKRYRFRVAYGGAITDCPVTLSVNKHKLNVISLDGIPINSYSTDYVQLAKGERVDLVVKANQDYGRYELKVKSDCGDLMEGTALISYVGSDKKINRVDSESANEKRLFTTGVCESKSDTVCLNEVQGLKKMPRLLKKSPDRTIYLPFESAEVDTKKDYSRVYRINNITFTYPPSPLLTQYDDIPYDFVCNSMKTPDHCIQRDVCECVHVEYLMLGSTVELILIDRGGDNFENNFHLHGYQFYVVGSRTFSSPPTLEEVKKMDEDGLLFNRNLVSPVQKDTVRVPKYGVLAIRFIANNPGFWMLRDGNSNQWTRGLDMVFRVGRERDLPAAPTSFPSCGSFIGPEFFLL